MYSGIKAHRNALRVVDYASAQACIAQAAAQLGRRQLIGDGYYPLGLTSRGRTGVRQLDEGEITFRLYDTDVVTWAPDGSVVIDNYGTLTTSGFAAHFLPRGVHLRYTVSRRNSQGGDNGIVYRSATGYRICFGGLVRLVPDGEHWAADESTLDRVVFPELDRRGARNMAARYHLVDFETWLSMAPRHLDIVHIAYNLDACLAALRKRDFRAAVQYLPLVKQTSSWGGADLKPLPIDTPRNDEFVTMGSFGKLKLAMWEHEGLFKDVILTTIGRDEYTRRMARVRQLNQLGFWGTYGPRS